MPTTSSPWASPSSPAGRRLLQSEPVTADGIPVLDEVALALGAALVAASSSSSPAAAAVPSGSRVARVRSGTAPAVALGRRALVAAALVMVLLAVGAASGLDRPVPAAPVLGPASSQALGRAAGSVLGAGTTTVPVPGGRVVVGLIEPTEVATASPGAPEPSLARRLGRLLALAAVDG